MRASVKKWISSSGQQSKNVVLPQTHEKEPGEHSGRRDRSAIVGIWEIAPRPGRLYRLGQGCEKLSPRPLSGY